MAEDRPADGRFSTLGLAAAALVGVAAAVSGLLVVTGRFAQEAEGVLLTLVLFAQVWFATKAARERSVRGFLGVSLLALVSAYGPVPFVWLALLPAAACAAAAAMRERRLRGAGAGSNVEE